MRTVGIQKINALRCCCIVSLSLVLAACASRKVEPYPLPALDGRPLDCPAACMGLLGVLLALLRRRFPPAVLGELQRSPGRPSTGS
jgi:hypothetical protein